MQVRTIELNSGLKQAVLVGICALGAALALVFAKWAFGHAVAVNAAEPEVTALGVDLAASDPNAHYAFGQLLEKTLLADDQRRAFAEFESAAALSPHNYIFWLALARTREQSGDDEGAERALRKALDLAPNYSRVHWALGNLLLRQGRQDEAFGEIRTAVAADESFAGPAASAAWQIFGGDIAQIHSAVGESPRINASIAVLLAGDKRYPEAMDFWQRSSGADAEQEKETAHALYNKLVEGGAYRSAIEVAAGAGLFPNWNASAGAVANGGFESALHAPRDAGSLFTWTVADGVYPRIGQNADQKRSGDYSLLISLGQGGSGQRPVTQKVGVEPGGTYELQFYYRSELTGTARPRCAVLTASGSEIGGGTIAPATDWTEMKVPFVVPENDEGIEVRITIEGCPAAGCPASGNVWLDDFSLTKH